MNTKPTEGQCLEGTCLSLLPTLKAMRSSTVYA